MLSVLALIPIPETRRRVVEAQIPRAARNVAVLCDVGLRLAAAQPVKRNPGTCDVSQGRRPDTRTKYEESP